MSPVLLPRPRSLSESGSVVDKAVLDRVNIEQDKRLPPQGYTLEVDGAGVHVVHADAAGEHYARVTLSQLARVPELREMTISDWPDLITRGVMLDISRDKVPTIATLESLIDQLASWKLNSLQLYTEHTFAYSGHEEVWSRASPLTSDEVEHLDRYCATRHIELVPNQNCLGHMERWLAHERYRPLAVRPEGWTDGRGRARAPTTIDPADPASLELVRDLLGQLLPHFASSRVHVGLDEPWELGDDRAGDYLDFVGRLCASGELAGREILMWGDVLRRNPDALAELPSAVTVCEWGYEADHPFGERASALGSARRPFWTCPGTSSWNAIIGRTTNMMENVRGAAAAAMESGGAGLLVTDWGDNGHLQYLPVSEPGFAWAAAQSWCLESNGSLARGDLAAALDLHCFADSSASLAGALLDLGDAHRLVTPQVPNMSVLALPLYVPSLVVGRGWTEGVTADELEAAEAAVLRGSARVAGSTSARDDASLVRDELSASCDLVALLCADARARLAGDGTLGAVPSAVRAGFASRMDDLIERHRELWLARNRPGGLDDSVARLQRLGDAYLSG